jgi:hypothetical protein
MTAIELRQKLIDQINRLSLQKLLFLEKLLQSLEFFFPETQSPDAAETHFLSESALQKDWLTAEEDQAWQDL